MAMGATANAEVTNWSLTSTKLQEDFPAMCLDGAGEPWIAYVAWDGEADVLKIARRGDDGLVEIGQIAGPGIIHQPAIACDAKGALCVVWSELDGENRWSLKTRRVVDGKIDPQTVVLEAKSGSAVFADAGSDRKGRVWVAWQSFRESHSDIFACVFDPATNAWSKPMPVTSNAAGDWEPRLAFGKRDEALIVFDSVRSGQYDVQLATVQLDGRTTIKALSSSPRYEGRASVSATADGAGLWLAWESGRERWGKNSRGVDGKAGLNSGKRVEVAFYALDSGTLTPAADATPVLKRLQEQGPKPKKENSKARKKAPTALNRPEVVTDAAGNLWLSCRLFYGTHWKIGLTRYDVDTSTWSQQITLENSSFGQDRRCQALRGDDAIWLCWPSDKRSSKRPLVSGVYLARVTGGAELPLAKIANPKPVAPAKHQPRWGDDSPERSRQDRHSWTVDGKTYRLYWGDIHRHTDVSNCRTGDDGCIVEQFKYAYDVGKLDFLGSSDHTDAGKTYSPYEWWCNQKLADVFQAPGFFNSFYVYEREQRWPWGHRNVVFGERGGPIVYIKRATYKASPWHKRLPVAKGPTDIAPDELWELLKKTGLDVSVISHTGATGMGTNWDGYEQIDNAVENLVEIYQGARVSYEGLNTPQPTVGFPKSGKLKPDAHGSVKTGKDFGFHNKGVYQRALHNQYKLGVFASSDHISTHASFGGVYAEDFSRQGILKGMNQRHAIAATDKIFMEFSCNGHMLGSIFSTDKKPAITVTVLGTAPLSRVTIVRNEVDYKVFKPGVNDLRETYTDPEPIAGENRYYLRVEQEDGNMGWASPIWVTYGAKAK
jgi:hypothetical protein